MCVSSQHNNCLRKKKDVLGAQAHTKMSYFNNFSTIAAITKGQSHLSPCSSDRFL